jgi:hypothetical protein
MCRINVLIHCGAKRIASKLRDPILNGEMALASSRNFVVRSKSANRGTDILSLSHCADTRMCPNAKFATCSKRGNMRERDAMRGSSAWRMQTF